MKMKMKMKKRFHLIVSDYRIVIVGVICSNGATVCDESLVSSQLTPLNTVIQNFFKKF